MKNLLKALVILGLIFVTVRIIGVVALWAWVIWGFIVLLAKERDVRLDNESPFMLTIGGVFAVLVFWGFFSIVAWAIFP